MVSKLCIVLFFISICFLVCSSELYSPHPRIVSNNGNLIIYAADHKNVTIRTTGRGYINLNEENLVSLLKNARNASVTVDRFSTNVIRPLSSSVKAISDLMYGPDGLLRRVTNLESNTTSVRPARPLLPRNRNFLQLSRRVRVLETNMMRVLNLLSTNECESNPCKNGGECIDMYNGFMCRCLDSWTGSTCETDVNECRRFLGTDLGCQNGATCQNKIGSYECICEPGWFGLHCTRRTNDCISGSQDMCGHGTCIPQNTPTGYKCICDQGWTHGIGPSCTVDVNECDSTETPVCSTNPLVLCVNVPGTFYCGSCPTGYTGNGYYCNDIDECLNYNGGCSINPKVQCINTMGSRTCGSCPPGYIGDGVTCSFQGICRINNGGCHPLARCLENAHIGENYVQCICPNGYEGSGMGPNGCILTAISTLTTACSSNPCVHGTCISNSNSSFTCSCQTGYSGKTCNIPINPCDSNPCKNGATCTNIDRTYSCECTTGYTGENCDKERQACGGKLTGKTGFVQFPPLNNSNYDHSVTCSWVIQTDADQVLNITFTKFHLEPADNNNNCLYDWVQIHDGPNSAAHMIGRFCGRELPKGGQITTTHNSIYVWFRSDHTVANPGFALKWKTVKPTCGGLIPVASHGRIDSPGSPGNYPPNRDCNWVLYAPYGKRLQFHFFTLDIGNNKNCSNDYLTLKSGLSELDPVIAQFCNSSHPEPVTSPGSIVSLYFHSDASGNYGGFQITYNVIEGVPGCGGLFTTDRGEIASPAVDGQYHSDLDCEYKIKLPGNSRIKITFLAFTLEDSLNCIFDFVSVHEGGRPDSPLVGRYCGSNIPPSYTSIGNELVIRFKTDRYINDDGFRIKYETVCGNIYDAPSGIITSPGYPLGSSGIKNCLYEIKQKPGTAIKLTISDLSIGRVFCNHDYLEIRDGDTDNATLIDKYCSPGQAPWVPPAEIISTHNYLRLRLIINSGLLNIGFKANYSTIDLTCGGILKENVGIIKSPENPKYYPPSTKCTWLVSAPPGFVIQLTWVLFNLEWSMNCNADYTSVYENNTESGSSALIGKYCGKKMPPTIVSTTNLLTLYFVSDMSQTSDGFIVSYNFMDESKTCGGSYFVSTGVIKSPNFPSQYPPNKECVWVITVPHGQQIMLNVQDFDLEVYLNCVSDYLEIRNGAYANSPLIGTFCGTDVPKSIPSHTNSLYIKFHSDSTHSRKGFQIFWDGTTTGCGGTLTSPTGQIISPNYPQPYGQNAMCLWKISTSAGSVLQIMFLDISLEAQLFCRLDFVEVYDGLDFSSKSLGRYCADTHPVSITTSKNRAMIKFRSDVSHEERGFLLKYLTVCNNTLKGYRGVVESLNFPNPYPKNLNCSWTIEVPKGNKINISFSHFDIELTMNLQNQKTCKFDYLEIVEKFEYSPDEVLLNKTCGTTLPPLIHSTKNEVQINFVTDSIVHTAGFRLEWVVDGCSGILTRPEGRIATPGYPNGYPTETVCEWIIQVDYDSAVELTIGKFDFESSNDCSYDSLQIFNGPDENAPLISKICHADEKGFIATSTSSAMFVKFTSDSSYAGRGFEARYRTVPSKCGGKFTAPMGSIHSRNFPKNYKMRDDCEWLIKINKNHIVELEFHEFDLVNTKNCTTDYVMIYDGNSTDAPLLKKICGGEDASGKLNSSTNTMFIRMTTGNRGTAKGFLANYTTACGSQITTSTNGMIEIGDWGSWDCSWTIMADTPDKHVTLSITHLDVSANCDSPALHIYDGTNSEAPLIGNYCGTKAPSMIVSKGSALHIDLSYAYGAYISATYSVISTDCGGTMTSLSGYFGSLGYPNNYPMNAECQWTINLAPGNKLLLTFLQFDLILTENCNADYVEIREKDAAGKLLGIFCGNTIPSNITQTNSLWVQFKSSDIGTAKGFLAEYVLTHGNELFGSKGQIASPLYPKSFGQSDHVTWRITVEFHSVILLTFKDFYVDWFSGGDCFFIGLEIYDGYDDTSPMIASLCSLQMPEPITTSSNVVFLKYFTGSYRYTMKFLLEWVQIQRPIKDINKKISVEGCGSDTIIDLTTLNNYTLQSPGYPDGYAGNLNCEWMYSIVPQKHLSITFTAMDLEGINPSCMLDNVKIYSGIDGKPNWSLVNTVCLSNSTMLNIRTSNFMKVAFKSDAYINKTGFAATIVPVCGGSLSDSNGVIDMLNYTTARRLLRIQCEWNITVKAGRTIQVTFSDFEIQNSEEGVCNTNFILIKNGIYPDSPLLGKGKYCGTNIPELNATSGNSLYIKYVGTRNTKGFKMTYTEVSIACGKHIKLTDSYNTTNISSPNYPDIPPPHTECIWVISAPPGEILQLDFIDRFDISYSDDCTKAGVELRDGGTEMSNLMDVFCTVAPSTQKTTDNLLYIRFFTDVSDPKNGFKATVSIATCGGTIRGNSGKLTSPYYPSFHAYPMNTVCTWQIIGPIDHYLNITFNDFQFAYRSNCSNSNHLLFTEKLPFGNETTLATLCGSKKPAEIRTSSNTVTIQMKIQSPVRPTKGFSLNFIANQEACGGTVEADSGFITSPGYPLSYHHNRNCEWTVIVPEGRRININILDFDLDSPSYYYSQGLAFYNSKTYTSNIAYMHGNDNRTEFKSSTNVMLVYFWSMGSFTHRGFKIAFSSEESSICTGDLSKNSGVISNPKANETSYFCQWVRRPQENENVFANRTLALIVDAPVIGRIIRKSCKYSISSLTVTSETESEIIRQFCGTFTEPQIIRNPYPVTKLTVIQGRFGPRINFTVTYKEHPCGGILTSSSGIISSPNYPNRYTDTIDCAWLIKIEEGQALKLNFTSMDLDKSCTRDYIDIYNGASPHSPKIGRYCGSNNPKLIQSQTNALWIEYHAGVGGTGKGFALNYEPLTAGCGGIFHDKERNIQTPSYPSSYPNNIECYWEVRSEEGYHVGLHFVGRFHLEESLNCTNDYVEVLDYDGEIWTSLGRYCGRVQPPAFNSSSNRLRIVFRSNSQIQGNGFQATWNFNCGGTYVATETPKYLISPGYPIGYTSNLDCKYTILAPKKYVNIIFEDFVLEEGKGGLECTFDNVTIGRQRFINNWRPLPTRLSNMSDLIYLNIGVYCGSKIPPPLRRQDGMRIWLKTDKWVDRKGFKLKYFVDSCGGPVTEEKEISSPLDLTGKSLYYSSVNCIWNITAPKNKVVIIKFNVFELEHHRFCQYDNVALYNGNAVNITERLALFCGNITNNLPVIRSKENTMLVAMKTDASNHFRGFKASVIFMYNEKVGCGGTVNLTDDQPQKIIRSPDIDGSGQYLSNLDCHWLILAPADETIELTFSSFHLSPCNTTLTSRKCTCDYLQIRDGGGPLSELMAQPCGHDKPVAITSSGNQLWIRFVSDGVQSSSGFRATVRKATSICGSSVLQVTDNKQILSSPGFPNNYPNNVRCMWTLRSNSSLGRIEIHFDHLEIQNPDGEDKCSTDKLEISDKLFMHSLSEGLGENLVFSGPKSLIPNFLGVRMPITSSTYCGAGQPPDFHSMRNEIVVSFTSDSVTNKKGFQIDYRIAGCNRNYTEVQGRLLNEGIGKECIIKISAPVNYTISLYFQSFFIHDYQNCKLSGMEIHDGNSSDAPQLVKVCGYQIPNPVFSNNNELWLRINTHRKGLGIYDIIYTTTNQGRGCGGEIYNYMGKFTSPMYPNNYRNNTVCRWNVVVPRGLRVALKFIIFDLGPIDTCTTDYVELIDINAITKQETIRSRYCAADNPAIFFATSNYMAVRYVTSTNNAGSGWIAYFGGKEQILSTNSTMSYF